MPSIQLLLGLVVAVLVVWILLKVARMAIRLILFLIAVALIAGAGYWLFMR